MLVYLNFLVKICIFFWAVSFWVCPQTPQPVLWPTGLLSTVLTFSAKNQPLCFTQRYGISILPDVFCFCQHTHAHTMAVLLLRFSCIITQNASDTCQVAIAFMCGRSRVWSSSQPLFMPMVWQLLSVSNLCQRLVLLFAVLKRTIIYV